ncbi:MAG: hypothetical protein ACRDTA_11940 [Pseudonocardiaceae bacterium]
MKRLVDRNLIERSRTGRRADLALLREDGSGAKYERPLGETKFERWLQLPHAYWIEGHYTDLSLPAKVILLIALSLDDGFALPQDRAPQWYGISADSADGGLRELVNPSALRLPLGTGFPLGHRLDQAVHLHADRLVLED